MKFLKSERAENEQVESVSKPSRQARHLISNRGGKQVLNKMKHVQKI